MQFSLGIKHIVVGFTIVNCILIVYLHRFNYFLYQKTLLHSTKVKFTHAKYSVSRNSVKLDAYNGKSRVGAILTKTVLVDNLYFMLSSLLTVAEEVFL